MRERPEQVNSWSQIHEVKKVKIPTDSDEDTRRPGDTACDDASEGPILLQVGDTRASANEDPPGREGIDRCDGGGVDADGLLGDQALIRKDLAAARERLPNPTPPAKIGCDSGSGGELD